MSYGFEVTANKEWLPNDGRREHFDEKLRLLVSANANDLGLNGNDATLVVTSIFPDYNKENFLLTQNNGNYRIDLTIQSAGQEGRNITLAVTYNSPMTLHKVNPVIPKSLEEYRELTCLFSPVRSAFNAAGMAVSLQREASELGILESLVALNRVPGSRHDLSRPITVAADFFNRYSYSSSSPLLAMENANLMLLAMYAEPVLITSQEEFISRIKLFFATYIAELTNQIISLGLGVWITKHPDKEIDFEITKTQLLSELYNHLAIFLRSELFSVPFARTSPTLTGYMPSSGAGAGAAASEEPALVQAHRYIIDLMGKTAKTLVPKLTQETREFLYNALNTYRFEPPESIATAIRSPSLGGPAGR